MKIPRLFALVAVVTLGGCASARAFVAAPSDLEDYRAFRVAAAEGTRLGRAQRYLERHPKGTFVEEVRQAFDDEEPRFFEKAQGSRDGVRDYIVDLPRGPHADAARALLVAFGSTMQDAELADLARRVRYEDAKLEAAAVQRRAVGEAILGAVGVLVADETYGVPRTESPKLRALLLGHRSPTWGGVPPRGSEDYFFLLPTRPDRESRLLELSVDVEEVSGIVRGARLSGADMLVRWAEADKIVALDASAEEDRTEAQIHTLPRLEGALERRFPAASCKDLRAGNELYHRACDGWEALLVPSSRAGESDVLVVRAPRAAAAPKAP